ncbi:MAG: beta-hydroxyacyl-ACP dehydratase [Bdellovibrionales bacterium]|nr:beta-hydroxyacyl-ACP dehydratase [Bdellovibrionales bacterium]
MLLNVDQVKQILPHRDPFLFIDSVESVTIPGKEIAKGQIFDVKEILEAEVVAYYKTKKDHAIFAGHFPDYPILPGVVQVEMMAQATSFIVLLITEDPFKMKMEVALLGINEARFRKPVLPDMELKLVTKLLKVRGPMITSECKLYHNDQLMSEVTVLASLKML